MVHLKTINWEPVYNLDNVAENREPTVDQKPSTKYGFATKYLNTKYCTYHFAKKLDNILR